MTGIFTDEGITGTQAKKATRTLKNDRAVQKEKIDHILTKSVSRFARNTVDCLNYVRELKAIGIGIIFEKENINTLLVENEMLLRYPLLLLFHMSKRNRHVYNKKVFGFLSEDIADRFDEILRQHPAKIAYKAVMRSLCGVALY